MEKLKDVLDQTTWAEVSEALKNNYSDYDPQLAEVYQQLHKLKPVYFLRKPQLVITSVVAEDLYTDAESTPFSYWRITGFDQNYADYIMDFVRWEEWLGYYIDYNYFMTPDEIVAHCLMGMTNAGMTQDDITCAYNRLILERGVIH